MKTTSLFTKIAVTTAIILSNLTISYATSHSSKVEMASKHPIIDWPSSNSNSPKTDSYLMVMQKQVEKGDISITYSFYMDQLTDLYQINQINADININVRFYMNNLVQQEHAQLLASDQKITDRFLLENAE